MHHTRKKIPLLIAVSILLFVVGVAVYIFGYLEPTYETPGNIIPQPQAVGNPTDETVESVIIVAPQANSLATSPLVIQGRAKGTWFFEAALPLQIMDANNTIIGRGVASAQAEWMTENLVPFVGTVEFTSPSTPSGWVVIRANNPSGLPENDDEFRIPVRFQ